MGKISSFFQTEASAFFQFINDESSPSTRSLPNKNNPKQIQNQINLKKQKKSQIFLKSTMRCKFTDQDVHIMENFYKNEPYPTTDQRFELAEQLGKPVKSVSGWFAGRRRKQVQNGDDLSALSKPINQKDTDGLLARLHGTRSIRNIISTDQ